MVFLSYSFQYPSFFCTFSTVVIVWHGELPFWSCYFGILYTCHAPINSSFLRFPSADSMKIFSPHLVWVSSPPLKLYSWNWSFYGVPEFLHCLLMSSPGFTVFFGWVIHLLYLSSSPDALSSTWCFLLVKTSTEIFIWVTKF